MFQAWARTTVPQSADEYESQRFTLANLEGHFKKK